MLTMSRGMARGMSRVSRVLISETKPTGKVYNIRDVKFTQNMDSIQQTVSNIHVHISIEYAYYIHSK